MCVVTFDRLHRLTDEERTLLSTSRALVAQALETPVEGGGEGRG
ncbi:hypothetical protein [Streptomyces sviceus]